MPSATKDLEVKFREEDHRAVIEGRTTVPFQSFVKLILQREVFALFKKWHKEPVIISSELLTHLASAPQNSIGNKSRDISVGVGVGVVLGVLISAIAMLVLTEVQIIPGRKELGIVIGGILALMILVGILVKMRSVKRGQSLVDAVESLSNFLR